MELYLQLMKLYSYTPTTSKCTYNRDISSLVFIKTTTEEDNFLKNEEYSHGPKNSQLITKIQNIITKSPEFVCNWKCN